MRAHSNVAGSSRGWFAFWLACAAIVLLSGCQARDSRLELTALRDPYFPENYTLQLDECAYHVAPGGDIVISGVAHQGLGDDGAAIEQMIRLRVFWRPLPGKTHDDPTSADALIEYVLLTEDGAVFYEGTAFAYVNPPDSRGQRRVDLEGARIRVRDAHGDTPDLVGGGRLVGTLYAADDGTRAMDLSHKLDRATTMQP